MAFPSTNASGSAPCWNPLNVQQWGELNLKYHLFMGGTAATSTNICPTFNSPSLQATYTSWNQQAAWTSTTNAILLESNWSHYNYSYEQQQADQAQRARHADYRAQRAEAQARMAVYEREQAAADRLAENLLLACLNADQAADHLEHGRFDVVSSHGRRFRIWTKTAAGCNGYGNRDRHGGQAGNVVLLDEHGKPQALYCVHPPDNLPHADAWLAQKLALEADEDTVMAVANMPWSQAGHQDIRSAARSRLQLIA